MINNKDEKMGLICILTGEYSNAQIRLKANETIKIGRAADNDLILEDEKSVSRNHCAITWYADEEAFGVCDTSSNGIRREDTYDFIPKNDETLRIKPGTVISIGGVKNQFLLTLDAEKDGLYPGMVIEDRYVVERILTKQAESAVYRCLDKTLGTPVAIRAYNDDERAKMEAQSIAKLRSAKDIVNVYGVLNSGDKTYIVMELVEWNVLSDQMKKWENMDISVARKLTENIIIAVKKFHAEGVHKGVLSPDNIYISMNDGEPEVKVYIGIGAEEDGISIESDIDEIREKLYRLFLSEKQLKSIKRKRRLKTIAAVAGVGIVASVSIVLIMFFRNDNKLMSEKLEGADFSKNKIEIWVDSEQTKKDLEETIKEEFRTPDNNNTEETIEIIKDNANLDENDFHIRDMSATIISDSLKHAMDGNGKKPDMFISDDVENLSNYNPVSLKDTVYASINPEEYYHLTEKEYDSAFINGYEIPTALNSIDGEVDGYEEKYCILNNGDEKRILACERLLWTLLGYSAQVRRNMCPIQRSALEYFQDYSKFTEEKKWLDEHEEDILTDN